MERIDNIWKNRKIIENSIKKHGNDAEHNFFHYMDAETKSRKNVFFLFDNDMGILAQNSDDKWFIFSEILAPEDMKIEIFFRFLDHIFGNGAKKAEIEAGEELRKNIRKKLKKSEYRDCRANYEYFWPVFDMEKWDGDKLEGKKWKKLRNIKNVFYKNHRVEVKDAKEIQKEKIKAIVKEWVKRRGGRDRALYERYIKLIDNNFDGCDSARTMVIDNEPCAITAGWKIPNTNDYYSGIGILNYRFNGLGEIANLDDLVFLKEQGFNHVNFGGSDKILLEFKKKFKPSFVYKTYAFSIVKRK